ncbi:MAG: CusA/CzcA family heavy metal efflux RND transporter [Bacteroidetes bacterium]|nr:CusA/CzcA family heavy metal efflux RND transporter [Bacteroidota bacterium]
MIDKIILFSIKNKLIVGLFTIALIIGGLYSMFDIPLDANPDVTDNQVQVITVSPNLGTEDIEQFVTYPVELEMANLPKVEDIRSVSRFGLSVVTIVFKEDMGTYLPRQLVSEALSKVKEDIPEGFGVPFMAPISTGLGEVYQYTLEVEPEYKEKYDLMELRTIQEWIVRRQMAMTPGVVEVNSFGGETKQYEIAVNPNRLNSMGITMSELFEAVKSNNQNTGGAYIEKNYKVNYIRGEGLIRSLDDIRDCVIKLVDNKPIYVRDVATVDFGQAIRYGSFTKDGEGEAVGGIVMMLKGENANKVISTIKERVEEIQKSLPEGVSIKPFLDRSEMIKNTTSTVAENIILGALIVIFILVLILGNLRGGLIVATTIPLALLFTFIMMRVFGVWANLMSLGAIDFGILIDGAVIIVESMLFYLRDKSFIGKKLSVNERDAIAHKASSSMMKSAFFGQLIIIIVFIPIMALQGIEGKMFTPMAMTFSFAVLGVLILCLTYIPMMSAWLIKAPKNDKLTTGDKIVRKIENIYRPVINWVLNKYKLVLGGAVILLTVSVVLFMKMGGEFIPQLDEGSLAMHILLKPGTALTEVTETTTKIEKMLITRFPKEIASIQTRIGVADIPTDPMPMDIGDCFIILNPEKEWTATHDKDELIDMMKETVSSVPGVNFEFSQPLEMRFNELLTGIREDLAIKIYGDDLNVLAEKAKEVEKLIGNIQGVGDCKAEATQGLQQITIEYDRAKIGQYGLQINSVNKLIETAFSGSQAGVVYEGQRRFDIVVRLDENERKRIEDVSGLYIPLENGTQIPLSQIAKISYKPGPMQISRENTNRRVYVGVNVRGRDVKSLVHEIQQKLDDNLDLPSGYYIRYGGAFENMERATNRLKVVVPISLAIIFLLVFLATRSFPQTLMIYMAIPLSAVGGVVSLYLRDMPFSISAGVGFIVLFGVAVMNGLVLISGLNELRDKGIYTLKEVIVKGSARRIRPILLTASTDILGFLPMAISTSSGAEVQRPLATVVIGGMLTATLLTLLVIPILYKISEDMKTRKVKKIKMNRAVIAVVLFMTISLNVDAQTASYSEKDTILITRNEVIERTIANYPLIKAGKLEIKKEKQLLKSSIDLGTTEISTSQDEIANGKAGSTTLFSVGQQDMDILGIYARREAQKSLVKVAEASLSQTQDEVILEVNKAYNNVIKQREMLELYCQISMIYIDFVESAKIKFEAEESSKIDLLAGKAQYNALKLKMLNVEAEYAGAKLYLNQFLQLDQPFTVELSMQKDAEILSSDLQQNKMLLLSQAQLKSSKQMYKKEMAGFLPKFNMSFKNQKNAMQSNLFGFEVGISVPLFSGQRGRTQASKTNIGIAEQNMETLRREKQTDLARTIRYYTNYLNMQIYYKEQALPLAEEQISATNLAYKLGDIDYNKFVQNMETSLETKQNYIENTLNLRNTISEIYYLTGLE